MSLMERSSEIFHTRDKSKYGYQSSFRLSPSSLESFFSVFKHPIRFKQTWVSLGTCSCAFAWQRAGSRCPRRRIQREQQFVVRPVHRRGAPRTLRSHVGQCQRKKQRQQNIQTSGDAPDREAHSEGA
ncbi:hypothetical protein, unlikely [Trypanosoma brucei gambiense DAL972]|uniref:Uncharacterized protein n=1 Tax=Trypanosoma brucei gambiense (strain MHOM/CI/86/DAL972) TaxID=679716 RepID=C9ZWY9_TRYB9|nr:hypothetical protein, unlikely [Trypanosoma brucei gambiense DAL972]CBH13930.1 hypothetical protein, unlikely [Trypanosoma brucei gambiense DAL972]|eukprot:XP_011776204.1 hypothetical protein, unlikely [Trypanosoma brucei gambiense DAL972]